ncbi:phosphoribosylaminoimidazolesuccinocarboxamide synthase [Pseudodesulfovibrio thermohalotolerans]|uniref:phosphoribosylaminoimidazolesuccinocarboxamide synthase n=1 Tax=Pseudodesulfovibrio thermohalotolerans TaxID=2880651 RepID=UPI00244240D0|nr:phosphoribosylaminoimidazolesuccinocarboxamide synthase [Pseudodesulfovibrio thermohalotolerans]WFS61343.1 phosphoribosylaminoimidazolesuccinocarboxamide synthase [Pseudodesulfovibrio thermohalotolerans]
MAAVLETNISEYPLISRGKVRDIYEIDADTLLLVTTDRISAFDVVMPDPIEGKGKVLNQITLFWMKMMEDLVPNHIIATNVDDYPEPLHKYREQLQDRSVLAKKAKPLPIECIVRGFITGSGWSDYLKTGEVCGHKLPEGLKESEMLETPLFTPSTKAELGAHDENISLDKAADLLGEEMMRKVEKLALSIYTRARDYAKERGILIADTKFEFGVLDGELIFIDEALTPDSSRFWPEEGYAPGQTQPSFDKQYFRNWLMEIGFNKQPPAPRIPAEIAERTRGKYLEAYKLLTGEDLKL